MVVKVTIDTDRWRVRNETSIDNDHVSCMLISTRFACVKSYSALLFCRVVFSFVLCLVLLIMEEEKEMIERQLNSFK